MNDNSVNPSPIFATTHWSVVLKAGELDARGTDEALAALCQTYWSPLYCFIRRSGHDQESAKDLIQSFFERLLQKNFLKNVTPSKGRFRSFLLVAVKHFLANEWDRQSAVRRGGRVQIISLDQAMIERNEKLDLAHALTPETIYERRWALALLQNVRGRLAAEHATEARRPVFEALQGNLLGDGVESAHADIAGRLGMSVDAVKKAAERLRRRFGELLRQEIAETVAHPSEIDDEIGHLRTVLSQ